jgi:phage terminase Nu1 subunit (DNA packaging protein)
MSGGETLIGVKQLAALINLTERRIQQLAREGILEKRGRGKYPLAKSVNAYCRYMQDGDKAEGQADFYAERARKMKADADLSEIEAAKAKAEVFEVAEMREAIEAVVAEVRAKLLNNAPTRIAAKAKSVTKESEIKSIAKTEIAAAMQALAKTDPLKLLGD